MEINVKLNDGFFHPMYNPNGWRCRFNGETALMWWETTVEVPEVDSYISCFKETFVYTGADQGNVLKSGRPDGRYVIYDDNIGTTEW